MLWFDAFFYGILGTIIGSFLNVCIIRHNTGRSLLGRSGCMTCGEPLPSYCLFPILSWIFLRGRALCCGVRISPQYPAVELTTGILFALFGALLPELVPRIAAFCVIALLLMIAVYDLRHMIIPDAWAYGFFALSILMQLVAAHSFAEARSYGVEAVVAGGSAACLILALWLITRGKGIGLGDAKLALGMGGLLGFPNGILALGLSFVIGAAVSVAVLLPLPHYRRALAWCGILKEAGVRGYTIKSEVPFGPFMVAGTLATWLITLFYGEASVLEFVGLLSL